MTTDFDIIIEARTAVGIGATLITEGRHRATVRVVLYTTGTTSCLRTPCTVRQSLLHACVNRRRRTTSETVVIGLSTIGTLAIATAQTAASTSVRLPITIIIDAGRLAVSTPCALTIVRSRHLATWALTISLGRASDEGGSAFVVHFYFCQAWTVRSTEVIATSRTSIATCTTEIVVTEITGCTGRQVRVEVMTTAPCGTVAVMAVLVITITIPSMLVVIGQREQEVTAVTCVTGMVPLAYCITTDQTTRRKLHH